MLCQLDPQAAAERDAMLRGVDAPPPLELPPLSGGALHRPAGGPDPLAGALSVQGLVRRAGREGRFDDVVGRGFQLIVADGEPLAAAIERAARTDRRARHDASPRLIPPRRGA